MASFSASRISLNLFLLSLQFATVYSSFHQEFYTIIISGWNGRAILTSFHFHMSKNETCQSVVIINCQACLLTRPTAKSVSVVRTANSTATASLSLESQKCWHRTSSIFVSTFTVQDRITGNDFSCYPAIRNDGRLDMFVVRTAGGRNCSPAKFRCAAYIHPQITACSASCRSWQHSIKRNVNHLNICLVLNKDAYNYDFSLMTYTIPTDLWHAKVYAAINIGFRNTGSLARPSHCVSNSSNEELENRDDRDHRFYSHSEKCLHFNNISNRLSKDHKHVYNAAFYSHIILLFFITMLVPCVKHLCMTYNFEQISNSLVIGSAVYFFKWHLSWRTSECVGTRRNHRLKVVSENEKGPGQRVFNLCSGNKHTNQKWLLNVDLRPGKLEFCLRSSGVAGKYSFDYSAFYSLPARTNRSKSLNPPVIQVTPVTRFLPDSTRNPSVDLAYVGYRLATLGALRPSVPVSRVQLANAGFYFQGQGDQVTCYSCHLQYSGWTREDNPMDVHRRLSPHCDHVTSMSADQTIVACSAVAAADVSNTPSNAPPNRIITETVPIIVSDIQGRGSIPSSSSEVNGSNFHAMLSLSSSNSTMENRLPETVSTDGRRSQNEPLTGCRDFGISNDSSARNHFLFPRSRLDLSGAVYPMYQDMASRRRTFRNWDHSQAPPLNDIILCGMFYAGYADCVRCFYCGVGLKHWVASDDVWTVHVRWRPGCEYLRAIKGDRFIEDTQRLLGIESSGRPVSAPGSSNLSQTDSQRLQNSSVCTSNTPSTTTAATTQGASVTVSVPSNHGLLAADDSNGHSQALTRPAPCDTQSPSSLQAENREPTSRRFQCRECHQAAIDTILLPCGHLVLCEICARSATSCPLCHDVIRASAKVHME